MNPSVAAAPKAALEHWRHRTTARRRNRRCPLARTSAWRRGDGGAGGNGSAGDAGGQCCSASARAITYVRSGDYVRRPSHAGGKASAKMCGAEACCALWRHYDSMPMSMLWYTQSAHSLSAAATATARTSGSVWRLPTRPRRAGAPHGVHCGTRGSVARNAARAIARITDGGARAAAVESQDLRWSAVQRVVALQPNMAQLSKHVCTRHNMWSQLSKRMVRPTSEYSMAQGCGVADARA